MQIQRFAAAAFATVLFGLGAMAPATAATLDRVKETGRIRLGYVGDARPFSQGNTAGQAEGYGISLCERIADQVKGQLGLSSLAIDWVPIMPASRFEPIQNGSVDLLCTPTSVTLDRRKEVSYSIPVFPGGVRAVLRADSPAALKTALSEAEPPKPVWRGSPAAKTLANTRVAVVSGTTTENWITGRVNVFQIGAKIVPVPDYKTGVQQLLDRKVDAFFGDRSAVLGAADPAAVGNLVILDRMFTNELYALALPRGDEDFRLVVDRALSLLYATGDINALYQKSFGSPSDAVRTFFKWNAVTP